MRDESQIKDAQDAAKKAEENISSVIKKMERGLLLSIEDATRNIGKGKKKDTEK
jgi:hypothetical protein